MVGLAIGVLLVIFFVSLIALICMCRVHMQRAYDADRKPILRCVVTSVLVHRNVMYSLGTHATACQRRQWRRRATRSKCTKYHRRSVCFVLFVSIVHFIFCAARLLNENVAWSHDSSGLIERCLTILHSTRRITERLGRQLSEKLANSNEVSTSKAENVRLLLMSTHIIELQDAAQEIRAWLKHILPCVDGLVRSMYVTKHSVPLIEARATTLVLTMQGIAAVTRLSFPKVSLFR